MRAVGFPELRFVHGVQQVVIEILDTCAFHRFIKNALHVGLPSLCCPIKGRFVASVKLSRGSVTIMAFSRAATSLPYR